MKKLFLLCVFFGNSLCLFAQGNSSSDIENSDNNGYITNKFWDNWFVSLGMGGQVYWGENDREGSFGKRIAPTIEISAGKWITPALGLRLQYNGFKMKGFESDPSNPYVYGSPDSEGLYKQKFNYMNLHGDILLNLSTALKGYKPDRKYELIPYVGFGPAWTYGDSGENDEELAFNVGVINKFRLSDALDLNLELKGLIVNQRWDGNYMGRSFEGATSISVGFTYKFKPRKFRKSVKPDYSPYEGRIRKLNKDIGRLNRENERLMAELAEEKNKKPKTVEVVKEVKNTSFAIFFKIGKADLTDRDMVNLKNIAETIKHYPKKTFKIIGSADSATGTKEFNQRLSEKRAKNVYDALVNKFNVNASQLKIVAKGGNSDISTKKAYLNRVSIVE